MAEPAIVFEEDNLEPDVSHLVTEDDTPVENFFQDKQMKMLAEALDVSWPEGRPFLSACDVGLFYALKEAVVPDLLLSVGVEVPEDYQEKNRRSYFIWYFGKPPEVVIEIVCNTVGKEDTAKLELYAKIKVPYYAIYDPFRLLSARPLRVFMLSGASYVEKVDRVFPEIGLGLSVWEGEYDGLKGEWLRWTAPDGRLLQTGAERAARLEAEAERERERAESERERAESERERAESEHERAESERARREAVEARLRELGVDPDSL